MGYWVGDFESGTYKSNYRNLDLGLQPDRDCNGATGTCQVAFEPTVGMFSNKGYTWRML